MDKEIWKNIEGIGNLYIEEELIVGTQTVLFTCEDDLYNKYLFMTVDYYEEEYIFAKIKKPVLIDMLEKKIPITTALLSFGIIYMTYEDTDRLKVHEYKTEDFPSDKLPKNDVYYTCTAGYVKEYMDKIKGE
jgi:hypothetical protein